MISEEEALARIFAAIQPLPPRRVRLAEALGCFAAENVTATIPLPMFDNSAMDGYAVRAADATRGAKLRVVGEQPAGLDRTLRVGAGEAVRIFTGGPVPGGADAVVMQEETKREAELVLINGEVASGEFIRKRGCDLAIGQTILGKGERLRPVSLALLASQGIGEIAIGGAVRIAILSTGDELVPPGQPTAAGQIYDSNATLLETLARQCGGNVETVEHCRDSADELRAVLQRLTGLGSQSVASPTDCGTRIVVVSGGVSVGEHDLVQATLRELGAEIDIWCVAIKPGKPFLFARVKSCLIFGLPGNPVSGFVTWLRLVRPAILKLMGASDTELPLRQVRATLAVEIGNRGDRRHYIRGRLADGRFTPVGRQESHAVFGLSQANALLGVDCGTEYQAGVLVPVELIE